MPVHCIVLITSESRTRETKTRSGDCCDSTLLSFFSVSSAKCCGFAMKKLTASSKSLPVHHFILDRRYVTFTINYKPLTFSVKREYAKLLNGDCDLIEFRPTPMEQSPWKANSGHLRKMKVRYRVHNSVSFVPILNDIKSFEGLPAYIVKIHFNIILICMPRFQNGLLLSDLPIIAL